MLRRVLRWFAAAGAVGFAVLAYTWITLPDVRELRTKNPTDTAFMRLREQQASSEGKTLRHLQRWMPYRRISQNLKRAVLVAEDDAFWDHEGVDFDQIRQSIEINMQRGQAVRGASTLTQQLAKNLYLSPSRNPIRKLKELIIARRLEAELPKARIFEIYLNVIEWGDGIWGADAAARTYFGVPASSLSAPQAALLAGAIINPRVLNPGRPTARLQRRQRMLLGRMGAVTVPAPPPVVVAPAPSPEEAQEEGESSIPVEDEPAPAPVDDVPELAPADPLSTPEAAQPVDPVSQFCLWLSEDRPSDRR